MLNPGNALITFFLCVDLAIDKYVALTRMMEIDTKSPQEKYYLGTI